MKKIHYFAPIIMITAIIIPWVGIFDDFYKRWFRIVIKFVQQIIGMIAVIKCFLVYLCFIMSKQNYHHFK